MKFAGLSWKNLSCLVLHILSLPRLMEISSPEGYNEDGEEEENHVKKSHLLIRKAVWILQKGDINCSYIMPLRIEGVISYSS